MLTIKQARFYTSGDISKSNSKMLGTSFGLDPWSCQKGSELAKIEGSVCHKCYAKRGTGIYPSVKQGRINNTKAIQEAMKSPEGLQKWVDAMVFLISKRCIVGFHRWHDAGDLQGIEHFEAIIKIAEALPDIKFWLPTKESNIIKNYKGTIPDNLCVRLSGSMIDGKAPKYANTSTVHTSDTVEGYECPAYKQDNKCGNCTACYDKMVKNVSYKKH